jgi:predicted site-specific integrase-resolvase
MSPHQGKFIAYFRVSTEKQGKSGLGLDAQRQAVLAYLNGGRWALVQEFVEVESGKRNNRPQLTAALAACKKHKTKLVIAKLDRLSRNLAFIAALMESGDARLHSSRLHLRWRSRMTTGRQNQRRRHRPERVSSLHQIA